MLKDTLHLDADRDTVNPGGHHGDSKNMILRNDSEESFLGLAKC